MSYTATLVIDASASTTRLETDAAVGNFLVVLSNAAGEIARQTGEGLSYNFTDLEIGDYTATAVLQDVNGADIGGTSAVSFSVAEATFQVNTVASLSVTVAKAT